MSIFVLLCGLNCSLRCFYSTNYVAFVTTHTWCLQLCTFVCPEWLQCPAVSCLCEVVADEELLSMWKCLEKKNKKTSAGSVITKSNLVVCKSWEYHKETLPKGAHQTVEGEGSLRQFETALQHRCQKKKRKKKISSSSTVTKMGPKNYLLWKIWTFLFTISPFSIWSIVSRKTI